MRWKQALQVAGIASVVVCQGVAMAQTKDGAMLGGVAGAVIGGIVGHQNDETPEGALIGGAVGAIAGGMIGHQRQQQEQLRYYQQQRYYQAPPAYHTHSHTYVHPAPVYTQHVYTQPAYVNTYRSAPVPRAVTTTDVIMLTRRGLSENVIINHIHSNGIAAYPTTDDVLTMHDAGVSDFVINEMQQARIFGSASSVNRTSVPSQPVIVREEYYTTPIDRSLPANGSRSNQLQPVPAYRQKF
jgi:hypothetical protein